MVADEPDVEPNCPCKKQPEDVLLPKQSVEPHESLHSQRVTTVELAKKETTDTSTDDCTGSSMPTRVATGATRLTGQADKTVFLQRVLQIIKAVSLDEPADADSDWACYLAPITLASQNATHQHI
jgi:hypothetical protein